MTGRQKKAIAKRLAQLSKKAGGLTPDAVVEDARDPKSPLRSAFPAKSWNDSWAAEEYRRSVARGIISRFRVETTSVNRGYAAPVFVRDPELTSQRQGYIPLASVKSDKERAREVLTAEFDRAMVLLRRSAAIADEIGLSDEFSDLLRGAEILQNRLGLVAA